MVDQKADVNEGKISNRSVRSYRKFNVWRIFWGSLAVLIGSLALADNFGLVTVRWANLWQLWPLIIIIAGLSMMAFRNLAGRIISVLFILVSLIAVVWAAVGVPLATKIEDKTFAVQASSSDVKRADLNLQTGMSSVSINSVEQSSLAKVNFQGESLDLTHNSSVSNLVQQINLSTKPKTSIWRSPDIRNVWDINLTRKLPLGISIDAGASDIKVDLKDAKLKSLNVKIGASNLEVKVGELESVVDVNISAGASSIKLYVPKDSGIKLTLDDGLVKKSLPNLVSTGENVYETSDYNSSLKQVVVSAKIGVSSIDIERY